MKSPVIVCPDCRKPLDEHLSSKEIARLLRCSLDTIQRMLRRADLPGFQIGGVWRVCPKDLERFVHDRHNLLGRECA